MLFRSSCRALLLLLLWAVSGCYPGAEGQVDEQKNPYFLAGKERAAERDYKGAIEACEKALESNPHSAQAHFELGVLYEQSSDQKEEDYVSAMYHYLQAIKLRPNDYPADNARQRVASCKRELVKAEALAPVAQTLMRELEKLKAENQLLHKHLDSCPPQTGSRFVPQTRITNHTEIVASPVPPSTHSRSGSTESRRPFEGLGPRELITPLPPVPAGRAHTVKAGETFYSIARQYHLKLEALVSANPHLDPKRMKVGQVLNLPSN